MLEDSQTSRPPSPTETLRRAAALMRERAGAAAIIAPPPWWSAGEWFHYYPPVEAGHDDTVHGWPSVGYGATGADVIGHNTHRETSDHIASWHPIVALAVADWLDIMAEPQAPGYRGPALAVARAYLGESV